MVTMVSVWTNKRSEFRHYCKGKKKLDYCDVCHSWDNSVVPKITKVTTDIMTCLECFVPDCWKEFKEQDISKKLNDNPVGYLNSFVAHLDKIDARPDCTVELHSACREHRWKIMKPDSWLQVSKWYGWHFAVREHMLGEFHTDYHAPALNYIYFLMDFMASPTLPIGPVECARWWYARARISVTVLAVLVWRIGKSPEWYVYLSHYKDHTALHTVAMLEDVIARIDVASSHCLVMWADTGKHFRAYEFLGYWTVSVPERFKVNTKLKHWPESHGKSHCDGFFGLLSRVMALTSLTKVLSDSSDLKTAWEEYFGAQDVVSAPGFTKTHIIDFEPPAKKDLPRRILNSAFLGAGISYSYFWSAEIRKVGEPIFNLPGQPNTASNLRLINHMLPGRQGESHVPVVHPSTWNAKDLEEPWKLADRDEKPEKERPPLRKVRKRYNAQFKQNSPLLVAGRNRPLAVRWARYILSQQKKKARAKANREWEKMIVVRNRCHTAPCVGCSLTWCGLRA